jgi:hypothetical protein
LILKSRRRSNNQLLSQKLSPQGSNKSINVKKGKHVNLLKDSHECGVKLLSKGYEVYIFNS